MKLQKLDRATLDVFSRISQYGLKQEFPDQLLEMFFRDALQSLIIKLIKANKRIRKAVTLHITLSEAICFRWTCEMWKAAVPQSYEVAVASKFFPELNNPKGIAV